jgi:hypothetical protein
MGDSLTRYQYMNFAYFVSKLHRMERYGDRQGSPSLCLEKEWDSWQEYYDQSSAILGAVHGGCGWEICDCDRQVDHTFVDMREYRTLQLNVSSNCSIPHYVRGRAKELITVSYHQLFGYPDPLRVASDSVAYYADSFRQPPPTVFILNMGLHIDGIPDYNKTLLSVFALAQSMSTKHKTQLLWKTTTGSQSGPFRLREEEMQLASAGAFTLYDVGAMAQVEREQGFNFRWDEVHYFPFVYEQFNDVLLNFLCPSE